MLVTIHHVVGTATTEKLHTHVNQLNSSVRMYEISYGELGAASSVADVLARLKSRADPSIADTLPGHRGSYVDRRLLGKMQSESEASSDMPRVVWNSDTRRFDITTTGPAGVKEFVLNSYGKLDPETELRVPGLKYAAEDDWIWDYKERPIPPRPDYVEVPLDHAEPPAALPAAGAGVIRLDLPHVSPAGGSFPIPDFPMTVTITDPNPPGTSRMHYSVSPGEWIVCKGRFQAVTIEMGGVLETQCISIDPDHYVDSMFGKALYTPELTVGHGWSTATVLRLDRVAFGHSAPAIQLVTAEGLAPLPYSRGSSGPVISVAVNLQPLVKIGVTEILWYLTLNRT
ncbi:MAG: hypothetical protein KDN22_24160 [Verrucomicrobiae bacterium]|nr:hypothetical protein [Verrucomicrobiae bacterium]